MTPEGMSHKSHSTTIFLWFSYGNHHFNMQLLSMWMTPGVSLGTIPLVQGPSFNQFFSCVRVSVYPLAGPMIVVVLDPKMVQTFSQTRSYSPHFVVLREKRSRVALDFNCITDFRKVAPANSCPFDLHTFFVVHVYIRLVASLS